MIFGSTGPRQQEESNVTERRRAVDPDAVSSFPSEAQQLGQLRVSAAADDRRRPQIEAELAAMDERRATFETALASSRPQTPPGEGESASLESSPNPSPPRNRRSPRRSTSPQAEIAALMQLFQLQMQQAADREQRHEEQAADREQRHEDQRRADRREAAEREARLEARLLQTPSTTAGAYRIGAAAKDFRPFEGKEDAAAYIFEFTHLLGTHEIPVAQWPRELSLKLAGQAANWYSARFSDLPVGTFPTWGDFYAAMLHAYGQSYGAAGAYQELHSLRRLPGTTGKAAYARVEEHSMLLRRKGVNNPGPEEQAAYILQNQLTTGESARWISLANADERISDATLHELELRVADARSGRHSCPPETREAFFTARREHLRNFLNEQGAAVGASAARAAVATGTDHEHEDAATRGAPSSTLPPADRRAMVAHLQAMHTKRGNETERTMPRYYGTPEKPESLRNATEFAERKASRQCFGCTPEQRQAQGPIPHWECKHHGQDASEADRAKRVPGSGISKRYRS